MTKLTADPIAVSNRLRPVLLKLNRELRREIHSLGVSGGQVALLIAVKKHPGIGVRGLADLERVSAPAMSNQIDKLEAAALIARRPSGEDRRRVGLVITPAGERVLRSVTSRRTAWLASRLRSLTPDQLAAIEAAVEPLRELIPE